MANGNGLIPHIDDRPLKVGVSGTPGSYSEKAAREWLAGNTDKMFELEYLVEIKLTLAALERGDIDVAVFPYSNTSIGPIEPFLDAAEQHNFKRIGKLPLLVQHGLWAMPGVTKEQIKLICSQGPAVQQCDRRLHRYWKHIDIDAEYSDTAKAAEDLAAGILSPTTAVIASLEAGKRHGLESLEYPFQDDIDNITMFMVAIRRG